MIPRLLLSLECFDIWYNTHINKIISNLVIIDAEANFFSNDSESDKVKIYIDQTNYKIKVESSEQILLFDKNKSIKLFKETNQLYIDKPDTSLFEIFSSILNPNDIENSIIKKSDYEYELKHSFHFDKIRLVFDSKCLFLDLIDLEINNMNIIINNIIFSSYTNIDTTNIFRIDGNYFEYDLRE